MITYDWEAEFDRHELERIEKCLEVTYSKGLSDTNLLSGLIKEMANALNRYVAILNEMEEEKHSE